MVVVVLAGRLPVAGLGVLACAFGVAGRLVSTDGLDGCSLRAD
jgi:hypothetical protein